MLLLEPARLPSRSTHNRECLVKGVAARAFNFFEIFRHDGIDAALIEVLAVNGALEVGFGLLDQERAFQQDLTARPAAIAVALSPSQQCFVFSGVYVGEPEPANLPYGLTSAEAE